MFRRVAAAATLSTAGLLAAAPLAQAAETAPPPTTTDADSGVSVLDNTTVAVPICGVGIPILSDILGTGPASPTSTAPSGTCTIDDSGDHAPAAP